MVRLGECRTQQYSIEVLVGIAHVSRRSLKTEAHLLVDRLPDDGHFGTISCKR